MGLLSAFMGGVAGPGFTTMSDRVNRRDEIARAEAMRSRELAADRQMRMDLEKGREGSALELAALKASLTLPGRGGASGSRSSRVAGSEFNLADVEDAILARDQGLSAPEAEARRRMHKTGANEFTKTGEDVRAEGDTRQMTSRVPDLDRFRQEMKALGSARFEAAFAGSASADDTAKAAAGYRDQRLSDAVIADPTRAGAVGTAQAAVGAKPIHAVQGNTALQQFTGAATPTEVGKAEMARDRAAAAESGAGAVAKSDAAKAARDNGGMSPAERVGLLNSYEAAAKRTSDEVKATESDLQKAQAAAAKAVGTQGKVDAQAGVDALTKRLSDLRIAADKASADAAGVREQRRAGAAPAAKAKVGITKAEYDRLPSGATYIGQDGKTYRKK